MIILLLSHLNYYAKIKNKSIPGLDILYGTDWPFIAKVYMLQICPLYLYCETTQSHLQDPVSVWLEISTEYTENWNKTIKL